MDHSYWRIQTASKPLFPDIEWNKPERRDQAGKLALIGGNKLGFMGVADSYQAAETAGAGHVRVLLPDALRRTIPTAITDVLFAPTNPSGSLSREALSDMQAVAHWSDVTLLAGDAGRNSETALLYDDFLREYQGRLVITRDAVDLVINQAELLAERENTILVGSFAQTQKLFRALYYPKMLTFSMTLTAFVEALHKFTITYPVTLVTLHQNHLVIATKGNVVSQEWSDAMRVWRGITAARIATYWMWSPRKPLEAAAASLV